MKKSRIAAVIVSIMICLSAAGCASVSQSNETSAAENTNAQTVDNDTGNNKGSAAVTAAASAKIDTTDIFSKRDLKQEADLSEAKTLTVKDGETLEITEEGVYLIQGTAKNCTIKVTADKEAKVQLVLDGVSITNDDFPAIYVVSADKCFITTTDSENTLSVTGEFKADGETNTDAVIYSKDDLVFNGAGTLTVSSAKSNGISGKDDIKFTGGTYKINSAEDAVEANDSIAVADGTFEINSSKDGFHAENDEDDTVGYVYIADGTFKITAKSDGIQATTAVQIDGGTFEIKSAEGIEATYVQINGGEINISASDDGINASKKSNSVGTPTFEMNGGTLTIKMTGQDVDCIDANGNIIVAGGTIDLTYTQNGPSESFDYDGQASFTGGKIIINGSEVSEIPTPMMMGGGNMGGGRNGGGFPGGQGKSFGGNGDFTPPEDFDMNDLPEGFDPENFDFKNMPGNFDPENMPEGFDKNNLPEGFDPENMPEDFNPGNFRGGNRQRSNNQNGDNGTTKQKNRSTDTTDA